MGLTAKVVLANKFWIVEQGGVKVGTIRSDNGSLIVSDKTLGDQHFVDLAALNQKYNIKFESSPAPAKKKSRIVHGFPVQTDPFNELFDVTKRVPVFTKQENSKSYYCAGYYLVYVDKAWVPMFCPKLITLNRNAFKGPFASEAEMQKHAESSE